MFLGVFGHIKKITFDKLFCIFHEIPPKLTNEVTNPHYHMVDL